MKKEEIKDYLLGMSDLAKRWKYSSVHGVRKRRKYDKSFPKPIATINKRVLVFYLPDIEAYEKLRPGLTHSKSMPTFYGTLEEWESKTREEREEQRGIPYSDDEWESAKKSS